MAYPISGYVLAGGKSSRMGRDKALLKLAGQPMVNIAVGKLRSVCASASILSGEPELAEFGRLVGDVHPACGPLGGIESGLQDARYDWSLFLAVDMPFVPVELLSGWVEAVLRSRRGRVSLLIANGVRQPVVCMVHRAVAPFIQRALAAREHKVLPVLEQAAQELASQNGFAVKEVLLEYPVDGEDSFANLNTPSEFAKAERRFGELLQSVSAS